jgi:hypothetical protein
MTDAAAEAIARLGVMSAIELRSEWRQVFKTVPPQFTPDMLRRALAWRMQERLAGSYGPSVSRELRQRVDELDGPARLRPRDHIKPGTRLVRSWQGVTHSVIILEDGFEYQGQSYGSLSAIAEVITGTRWSGPRFFGLSPKGRSK